MRVSGDGARLEQRGPAAVEHLEPVAVDLDGSHPMTDERERSCYDRADVAAADDRNVAGQKKPPGRCAQHRHQWCRSREDCKSAIGLRGCISLTVQMQEPS